MIAVDRLRLLVAEATKRRIEIEAVLAELQDAARELAAERNGGGRDATAD